MPPVSSYYFEARLKGRKYIQGIPVFALHVGQGPEHGWNSGTVTEAGQLADLVGRANRQVPVYLAMPRLYAHQYFIKNSQFSEVILSAFRPMQTAKSDNYAWGASVELVLENVDVLSSFPVMQRKGLPFPPRVQQNFLNKKFGTEAYYTIAVKLSVQQGSAFS